MSISVPIPIVLKDVWEEDTSPDPHPDLLRRVKVEGKTWRTGGTIDWEEHLKAWKRYDTIYHNGQSADTIANRGGWHIDDLIEYLGHHPKSFQRHDWK